MDCNREILPKWTGRSVCAQSRQCSGGHFGSTGCRCEPLVHLDQCEGGGAWTGVRSHVVAVESSWGMELIGEGIDE